MPLPEKATDPRGILEFFLLCFSCLGLAIFAAGCQDIAASHDVANPPPLEFEEVAQYKINYNPATNVPESISGFCMRGWFCVKSVTKKREGNALVVLVNPGPCKTGETGDFLVNLDLTDDVDRVLFGPKKHVLWTRGQTSEPATIPRP